MLKFYDLKVGSVLCSKRLNRKGEVYRIVLTEVSGEDRYLKYRRLSPKTGRPIGKELSEYFYRISAIYTDVSKERRELNTRDMVDLKAWEEWRNASMVPGRTGMGNTPMECLTKEGIRIRDLLTDFLGIAPKYQAASYKHFYFKWDVLNAQFRTGNAAIVSDLLTDEGHTVEVEHTDRYLKIIFAHVTPIPKDQRSRTRGRESIEIPHYGEN